MKKILYILTAILLVVCSPAGAQNPFGKTRRQLERENAQLRERLESLQQELQWLKSDINERDSLRKELVDQIGRASCRERV